MDYRTSREEWLKSLKVGDSVILTRNCHERLLMVDRITPGGQICVGTHKFNNKDGRSIGDVSRGYAIIPVTQQYHDNLKRRVLLNKVNAVDWGRLKLDVLEEVVQILVTSKAVV